MKQLRVLIAAFSLLAGLSFALAQDPNPAPPESYVNVSTILPLPEFIPTVGALYIDPANAPVGPYLAYGNDGSLVEVVYMVPLADLDKESNWDELKADVLSELGVTAINHVDISYNGGHPGMEEPHYHIRLVLVDEATQQSALSQ